MTEDTPGKSLKDLLIERAAETQLTESPQEFLDVLELHQEVIEAFQESCRKTFLEVSVFETTMPTAVFRQAVYVDKVGNRRTDRGGLGAVWTLDVPMGGWPIMLTASPGMDCVMSPVAIGNPWGLRRAFLDLFGSHDLKAYLFEKRYGNSEHQST